MAKITISIPDEIAEKANRAVRAGLSGSVSAYFTALAQREPDWAVAEEILAELSAQAGVTESDLADADAALDAAERAAADGSLGGAA
ncbi:hypothetical protein D7D52_30235 [Nocardia yunnanensis]|uniref:Toxin-antitoxin system antitoxin subunit n=1 Tax=Nocardia yunnanensis TaxID=2382165 RepID=A0A386ZL82_9NOCA|nr:hypothetical protein [Nocardia yunnanensis]AYF77389.1 hypothetical protein D7D52_30235 [Nocardia yunnanensis]